MRNITGMWSELKMSVVLLLSFLILLPMKGKFISIHTTQIKYLSTPPPLLPPDSPQYVNTKEDGWLNVHNGEKVENGRKWEQKNEMFLANHTLIISIYL